MLVQMVLRPAARVRFYRGLGNGEGESAQFAPAKYLQGRGFDHEHK